MPLLRHDAIIDAIDAIDIDYYFAIIIIIAIIDDY
jgi:hypothetical protein